MPSLPDSASNLAKRLEPIISPDEVLDILGRYLDGSDDPDTRGPRSSDQPKLPRSEADTDLSPDRPERLNDLLDRAPLALSLASLLNRIWHEQNPAAKAASEAAHRDTDDPAFVMHLDAPWGGGKTTIANFIEALLSWDGSEPFEKAKAQMEALNERARTTQAPRSSGISRLRKAVSPKSSAQLPRNPFARLELGDPADVWLPEYMKNPWSVVWFNAWRNQHVRPPWWNFYEVIRSAFLKDKSATDRAAAWISEAWWKLDKRRLALNVALVVGLVAFFSLDSEALSRWWTGQGSAPTAASGLAAWLGSISGPLIALGGGAAALFFSVRTGAQNLLASVSGSADSTALGDSDPLDKFRKRFVGMAEIQQAPILVIIDDVDRCEPDYVVELLRGIITVFRTPRVVFLLLGDRFWIEQCFEQVHPEMAEAHGKAGIGFGGHFVEKAIQLSFLLPEPPEARRKQYLRHVLRMSKETGESEADATASGSPAASGDQTTSPPRTQRRSEVTKSWNFRSRKSIAKRRSEPPPKGSRIRRSAICCWIWARSFRPTRGASSASST